MTRTSIRSILIGFVCSATLGACKSSTPPPLQGPPSKLVPIGGPFTALANTELTTLQISVQDANNIPIAGQTVTFTVIAGGGCFPLAGGGGCGSTATAISDANGTVTVPPWRLGKSAVEQKVEATLGSIIQPIEASVQTLYNIVLRYWGTTPVSDANKVFFTNAAARIRGIVTGDIENVQASNFDLSLCGVVGEPPLNETIDDVVIYVSIQPIDGAGDGNSNIVAQAGPCAGRPTAAGYHTAIGVMQFDSHDFPNLGSNLQDVVTHEMMHVLGFGVYWDDKPPAGRNIMTGSGSGDPRYTGAQGRLGCVEVGGTTTCASSIPLENAFGAGSNDSHWRESVFVRELMTSLLNPSNPISLMTVRSFSDLGFVVNSADFDAYTIPGGALRMNALGATTPAAKWEKVLPPTVIMERDGSVRRLRPLQ